MGVDFSSCYQCDGIFCDCGDYIDCPKYCGRTWCSEACAAKDGVEYVDAEISDDAESDGKYTDCNYCRKLIVEDSLLLEYLLKKHQWSKQNVIDRYCKDAKQ